MQTTHVNFYRIVRSGHYYYGYTPESGSIWCLDPNKALLLDDTEIPTHLAILTHVESLSQKELEIQKAIG